MSDSITKVTTLTGYCHGYDSDGSYLVDEAEFVDPFNVATRRAFVVDGEFIPESAHAPYRGFNGHGTYEITVKFTPTVKP